MVNSRAQQALEEKTKGNEAYKRKEFETAITHYKKALELDKSEITFYSNLAAVFFEQKNYGKCIDTCKKAVDIGRENRADVKPIAKALARMGKAYKKMNDLDMAKVSFEKAVAEHRTRGYRTALSEIETLIKKKKEQEYINPELANEEKQKAYLHKAMVHKDMGQTSKAKDTHEKALGLDPNCTEAMEGLSSCSIQSQSDPEVNRKRARMILEQMQNDPELESEIKTMIKKKEELEYINSGLANEEKQKGDESFKSGDFSSALNHYTEAINRHPSDSKIYSNRAACHYKLMSFDLALKDCDKSIELDPNFIKAYLRKAMVHKDMGHTSKAKDTYEKALVLDPNCAEAMEGVFSCSKSQSGPDVNWKRTRALKEKTKGNEAYKRKEFKTAITHYKKALELDNSEITIYSNLAAVFFEQKNYGDCVSTCQEAVDIGRENRAELKLIAKALMQMGNAFKNMNDLDNAKVSFGRALSEHRTPEYRTALSEIENLIKKKKEQEYINLELANEEKQKGDELFKSGDFSSALNHYSEAIRRNPLDIKIYGYRAACHSRLISYQSELLSSHFRKMTFDYEKALGLDPNGPEAMENEDDSSHDKGSTGNEPGKVEDELGKLIKTTKKVADEIGQAKIPGSKHALYLPIPVSRESSG